MISSKAIDLVSTFNEAEFIEFGLFITKKLFDIKNRIEEKDFDLFKIRKDISDNKAMINKSWLLERADKIEKSLSR